MDAAVFDAVGGIVVAVLGSGGGRVLYVRSRNAHQVTALAAEASAIEAYGDFEPAQIAMADQAEAFVSTLGPQSAEAYRCERPKGLGCGCQAQHRLHGLRGRR